MSHLTSTRPRLRVVLAVAAVGVLAAALPAVTADAADAAALRATTASTGTAAAAPASPVTLPGGLALSTASIAQLQAGLVAGTFTSVDLTRAYLARIEAISYGGPRLNAVREVAADALTQAAASDAARRAGQASGPLFGIPILLKDNIDAAGMPTTAGSVALANSYPRGDATLTASLRRAGAIILGKANLTEFANYLTSGMPGGYSSLGGQVLNAYDLSQSPSGSSAGPGVAASTAMAAGTVGSETSGSILSPSAANALVGIKPTVGLISRTGVVPISATQDTAGPMTRSVADAAAILTGLTTGADPEDSATLDGNAEAYDGVDYTASLSTTALQGVRLGYVPTPAGSANPVYDAAIAALAAQGAVMVPVAAPTSASTTILDREFKRDLNAYLARLPASAPVTTLAGVIAYNTAHADVALKFGQTLAEASQLVDLDDPDTNARYQADKAQSVNGSRAAIEAVLSTNDVQAIVSSNGTTGIGARAGYPSITLPAGFNAANRRPVPVTFLGTAYSEQRLISYASDLEAATQVWRAPEVINPTAFACTPLASPGSAAACDQLPPPVAPVPAVRGTVIANAVRNPVRAGTRARIKVAVVAGATVPTGSVVVRIRGKQVGARALDSRGRATIKLSKRLKPGYVKAAVIYLGDGSVLRAKAKVRLRILR